MYRMAKLQPSNQSVDQFLEIDDAHEVLDVEDIEEVTREKERLVRKKASFETFGEAFSSKRREYKAAKGPASGINLWRLKGRLPETGRIAHSEAKKSMPPGGQLWQDTNPGS